MRPWATRRLASTRASPARHTGPETNCSAGEQQQTGECDEPTGEAADKEVFGELVDALLVFARGELGKPQQSLGRNHDAGRSDLSGETETQDEHALHGSEQSAALELHLGVGRRSVLGGV